MRGTCAVCQVCYYSCPRIELPLADVERRVFGRERTPEEAILGINIGRYSAKAKDPELLTAAQDGGAGTALVLYAFDQKIIAYAVVSGYSFKDPYRPEPQIASTREDLIKTAGSRYTPGGQVGGLGEIAIPNRGSTNSQEERLAILGLPCELQGMWRMTTHWIATPKLAKTFEQNNPMVKTTFFASLGVAIQCVVILHMPCNSHGNPTTANLSSCEFVLPRLGMAISPRPPTWPPGVYLDPAVLIRSSLVLAICGSGR